MDNPNASTPTERLTVNNTLANAARLLRNAETITDLALMERYERLADSWIAIARTLADADR